MRICSCFNWQKKKAKWVEVRKEERREEKSPSSGGGGGLRRPSHFLLIPPYSFSHWMRSWNCWTVNKTRNAMDPIGWTVTIRTNERTNERFELMFRERNSYLLVVVVVVVFTRYIINWPLFFFLFPPCVYVLFIYFQSNAETTVEQMPELRFSSFFDTSHFPWKINNYAQQTCNQLSSD